MFQETPVATNLDGIVYTGSCQEPHKKYYLGKPGRLNFQIMVLGTVDCIAHETTHISSSAGEFKGLD
jgi:hypothetical protein